MIGAAIVVAVAAGNGDEAAAGSSVPPTTVQATQSETTQPEVTVTAFDRSQLPRDLETVSEGWKTDFSRTTIGFDELAIGIRSVPIRDRIPPIDQPVFESAAARSMWPTGSPAWRSSSTVMPASIRSRSSPPMRSSTMSSVARPWP